MLGIPFRYMLKHPVTVLSEFASDPRQAQRRTERLSLFAEENEKE